MEFGVEEAHNFDKSIPGCLGSMVNLFDMSTGVSGSGVHTDKLHRDGSPLSRCWPDTSIMSPVCDPVEDKTILSDLSIASSNKSLSGTPIKMLIAHEMSREMDFKHNSPSLVAKLMGLDALPGHELDSPDVQRSHSRYYSQCHSGIPLHYWQEVDRSDMQMQREAPDCLEHNEYKDVYEVSQQPHKESYTRNKSPQRGTENPKDKKMALVREKFNEAKRLATDEKLRQSRRFQDALEVLSTNKDVFLKFLQEPNSLISQHQFHLPSLPASEPKRITVLRPSKMVDSKKYFGSQNKNEKQTWKTSDTGQVVGCDRTNLGFSPPGWKFVDNLVQPTRIVVLKPSPGKVQDIKAVVSPPSLSPRVLHSDEFLRQPEDDDDDEKSREVAMEITRQMQENLTRHRRDDTLLSSVFSNGYVGDESSFHKSENEFVVGDLSESEIASPISRHSWDYIHRVGSPFSSSSIGRVSCSPESSVCREAKKRLSERWAIMASKGTCVEQPKHVRRNSNTLGEMLALSDPKSSLTCEEGTSKDQEARGSTSCLTNDFIRNENGNNSPRDLLRSRSVPISSTIPGNALDLEVSNPEVGKTATQKEVAKSRSLKTSLKGKVSSFFSRGKRSGKEKTSDCQSKDESHRFYESASDSANRGANGIKKEDKRFHALQAVSDTTSLPDSYGVDAKHRIILPEVGLSLAKPWPGNSKDNQDQPSPISVLEQLFEEDDNITPLPCNTKQYDDGANLVGHSLRSNLIDKSPPIGSIARTLPRDNFCSNTPSMYALQPSPVANGTAQGEQDWLIYLESLLSAVGLNGEEAETSSRIATWHSSDSPLDPSLRDRYVDLKEKGILTHEGRRRQMRSTRKLVFDCVNSILIDTTSVNEGSHERILSAASVDRVWAQMKEWFSVEMRCDDGDGGDSLVVERVVKKEVVGKGWAEHRRVEMDNLGKEIEGKLLDDLMYEAVLDLTGRL